jgi:hypothetical protein
MDYKVSVVRPIIAALLEKGRIGATSDAKPGKGKLMNQAEEVLAGLAAGLSATQERVLRELAEGNRLAMQRQGAYDSIYARWEEDPAAAPRTVGRATLRALIGAGYVATMFDGGLFLPRHSFALTEAGRRALGGRSRASRARAYS